MSSGRERLYAWDEKSIKWYENAVDYRSFHSDVAEMVLAALPAGASICDIGCGIGALTLHLAPRCSRVLAMDLNSTAISVLERRVKAANLHNVTAITADFDTTAVPAEKYDAAVFCLAGGVPSFLERAGLWAKRLFFIENATDSRSFSSVGSRTKEIYYSEDINYLKTLGIPFQYQFFSAPFGQVFTSREDAEAFMRHYNKDEGEEDIRCFLDNHLLPLDHPEYSLFLPNEKPLLMIDIPL